MNSAKALMELFEGLGGAMTDPRPSEGVPNWMNELEMMGMALGTGGLAKAPGAGFKMFNKMGGGKLLSRMGGKMSKLWDDLFLGGGIENVMGGQAYTKGPADDLMNLIGMANKPKMRGAVTDPTRSKEEMFRLIQRMTEGRDMEDAASMMNTGAQRANTARFSDAMFQPRGY